MERGDVGGCTGESGTGGIWVLLRVGGERAVGLCKEGFCCFEGLGDIGQYWIG